MKQLSDQDATYLYLETQETPQHVGSVSLVALAPGYEGEFFQDYKQHIAARIHLVPLLYSKLVPMPLEVDHPVWAEDDSFDIDYHVRRQTVPRPGRLDQLEELVGRLHSNFLDRSRPLWEFYVIDGLESGQVAIYTKIHHAAMDGASSQLLIQALYDLTPEPREIPPPPPRAPASKLQTGVEAWVRGAVTNVVRHEIRALQLVPDALKALSQVVLPNPDTLRYDKPGAPPPLTPKSIFNVSISSQRSFAARSLPLGPLKRVAKQAGVKLNDVVLAVCSGALRTYLMGRNALPDKTMTAIVPVSLRDASMPTVANQNALFVCSLASHIEDPHERLMSIFASSTAQKKHVNQLRGTHLPDLMTSGSGPVMRAAINLYCRAKLAEKLPPMGNLWISNVPGPQVPLYVVGARILSFYPCSIPFHGAALNITAESYGESLDFGLTACRRTLPDVARLADALAPAFDELKSAVERHLASSAEPEPVASPARAARKPPAARKPAAAKTVAAKTVAAKKAAPASKAAPRSRPASDPPAKASKTAKSPASVKTPKTSKATLSKAPKASASKAAPVSPRARTAVAKTARVAAKPAAARKPAPTAAKRASR
jgi:diacylglycerol O-acyltransferase / wax synthase